MPRPLKRGILGASTIILSKDIDKYAFMCGSNFYESDVKKKRLEILQPHGVSPVDLTCSASFETSPIQPHRPLRPPCCPHWTVPCSIDLFRYHPLNRWIRLRHYCLLVVVVAGPNQ